ncbi:transposase [Streptomyces sp. NPDC020799]|uniref:transposase n=1 Tax=Streptomyces sp. NPDC020799 TaxID=3365091 RepID=UPI0037999BA4
MGKSRSAFGYPLLRLCTLVECGTRALLGAAFGPEDQPETAYASRLLDKLTGQMLVLLDAGFDSADFLLELQDNGAHFLCRSGASRNPLIHRRLPDGSYLSMFRQHKKPVRIIEAWITVRLQDGTVQRQQWRLLTSLMDHTRHPAAELVEVYHQRWEIEISYFSIKCSLLHGRVLRSARCEDIEQEVYALLAVHQAVLRITDDAVVCRPGLDPDRISVTVALETARDEVLTASGILAPAKGAHPLIGAIGNAVLDRLLPPRRRRLKARIRKGRFTKYCLNAGKTPVTQQQYTVHTEVVVMEEGLTNRSRR